jgi:hypothetical protein
VLGHRPWHMWLGTAAGSQLGAILPKHKPAQPSPAPPPYLLWPVVPCAWHVVSAVDDLQLAVTCKRQPAKAQHIQQHTQGLTTGRQAVRWRGRCYQQDCRLRNARELFHTLEGPGCL